MDFLSILTQVPVLAASVTAGAHVFNNAFKIKGTGAFATSLIGSFTASIPLLESGKTEYIITSTLVTLVANGIFKLIHAAAK